MKKIDLYPSSVYIENYFNNDSIDLLLKETYNLYQNKQDNDCSVRNGWQSRKDIYDISVFAKFCDFVLSQVKTELLKNLNVDPYISAIWCNVQNTNGFNHVHTHAGSWYSGVYYLKCSDKSGEIKFTDPRPGAEVCKYNNFISPYINKINPQIGDLILFPSWLPHLVESNCDSEDRVSIAFNIELNI